MISGYCSVYICSWKENRDRLVYIPSCKVRICLSGILYDFQHDKKNMFSIKSKSYTLKTVSEDSWSHALVKNMNVSRWKNVCELEKVIRNKTQSAIPIENIPKCSPGYSYGCHTWGIVCLLNLEHLIPLQICTFTPCPFIIIWEVFLAITRWFLTSWGTCISIMHTLLYQSLNNYIDLQ